MHVTIKDSPNLLNSQYFGTHSFFVTRQKDSEVSSLPLSKRHVGVADVVDAQPRAASAWNDFDTANPIVDFKQFVDGESLDQEDLTLWFNLGMHHIPQTADLPNASPSLTCSGTSRTG